ncbi:hypothetical protein EVC02_014 [Rhizobium phage RHph_N17]|nr:hypothetical protein EVC02_014 [Rhizobium phage RHph_N17]
MKCKLVPGQHVLCIATQTDDLPGDIKVPEIGKVYTVGRVTLGEMDPEMSPCVTLEEIGEQEVTVIINGLGYIMNVVFDYRSFKPLDRLKVKDFLTDLVPA